MRRTRKHNKKIRKTRRGGGQGSSIPLLPPSPSPTPPPSPNIKKPQIKIGNKNLIPVQRNTYNWYKRQEAKKALERAREPPLLKKILGIKNEKPNRVPVNSYGDPIKSFFNINKNRGFTTKS